jgi:kumamolisin
MTGNRKRGRSAATIVGVAALPASATAAPHRVGARKVAVAQGVDVPRIAGAVAFGTTPAHTHETVAFVLKEKNISTLESDVTAGIDPSHYMTVSQFASAYGRSSTFIDELQRYLAGYGIRSSSYPDHVDVVANGTAGEFDRALSTSQKQYQVPRQGGAHGGKAIPAQRVHAATSAPQLPSDLASKVLAVLGLTNYASATDNLQRVASATVRSKPGSSCTALTGLPAACKTASDFASQYGLDGLYAKGDTGQGQTLGIVTLAAMDPAAPKYYWAHVAGIHRTGSLSIQNVDGGPGAPSNAAGSSETDLDVEQSGGVAPGANVIVYQAPNTDPGFADAFFTAASEDTAGSVSTSWGESETVVKALVASGQETPAYQAAFDEAFLELAAQGQAAFAAAGDSGAYDASRDLGTTNLSVDTPADSPYITAAGGTTDPWSGTLTGPDGSASVSVTAQRAWGWDYLWQPIATITGESLTQSAESQVVGGGGGFSAVYPTPSYQQGVTGTTSYHAVGYLTPTDYKTVAPGMIEPTGWSFDPTPSVTSGTGSGRALPDVSANADPYSGYLIYAPSFAQGHGKPLEGGWGGTSFVGPQLNGSTAVIDSAVGHRVGFWNPSIYGFAQSASSPFTPLDTAGTSNDNIYYTGNPGDVYNQATGLGTPDLTELATDFGA